MARYRYSESDFRLIENSCLAFGVYQFLDRRVVTVALSEGLLELFGLPDRAEAYALMDNDNWHDTDSMKTLIEKLTDAVITNAASK